MPRPSVHAPTAAAPAPWRSRRNRPGAGSPGRTRGPAAGRRAASWPSPAPRRRPRPPSRVRPSPCGR
ncbi:hypothetical protein DEF23_21240 [Marinitenerispora sediminis]|uniref:Uncharacterized protein n=1 Tax=Marinitenerispora sediminis TaxID=1931232 RepID=A0A368T1K7_9ACTN|nr:hypothetical protein DEF23_21240 [Marinitenerispora sediminis]RCV53227.1 hypothetical protein DEF28_10820 [Marinitenerispora sediminis]RCV54378.1 hypothetical protein DEF24_19355 [Marinitenerispora sediminis]